MSTIKKVAPGVLLDLLGENRVVLCIFFFEEKGLNSRFHSNIHRDNHSNQGPTVRIFSHVCPSGRVFVFELSGGVLGHY